MSRAGGKPSSIITTTTSRSETFRKCLRVALPLAVTAVALAAYIFIIREQKPDEAKGSGNSASNSVTEVDDQQRVGGGASAVSSAAHEGEGRSNTNTNPPAASPQDLTRDEFIQLLDEMVKGQTYLERLVEDISTAIREKRVEPTFSQVYKLTASYNVPDPLQSRGLKITDFDVLVEKHGGDPEANRLVELLLQGSIWQDSSTSGQNDATASKPSYLSCDDLLEVNQAMLTRLQSVVAEARAYRAEYQRDYDTKIGSAAAQAILSAYLKQTYNVTASDLERALVINEVAVSTNPDFIRINDELHVLMAVIIDPLS